MNRVILTYCLSKNIHLSHCAISSFIIISLSMCWAKESYKHLYFFDKFETWIYFVTSFRTCTQFALITEFLTLVYVQTPGIPSSSSRFLRHVLIAEYSWYVYLRTKRVKLKIIVPTFGNIRILYPLSGTQWTAEVLNTCSKH